MPTSVLVDVDADRWRRRLLAAVVVLVAASVVLTGFADAFPSRASAQIAAAFDVDHEDNVPTLFSTLLLIAGALGAWLIARVDRARGLATQLGWTVLAVAMVLLAFDEAFAIHERFLGPMRRLGFRSGPFYFGWVVPALALLALVAPGLWTWSRRLPEATRRQGGRAVAVVLAGALGIEMLFGALLSADIVARDSMVATAILALEELLEMLGIVFIVDTILGHLTREVGRVSFDLQPRPERVLHLPEAGATTGELSSAR